MKEAWRAGLEGWARAALRRSPSDLAARADEEARIALSRLPPAGARASLRQELEGRGIHLEEGDLRVGPARIRARLDLDRRTLTWDPETLARLARAIRRSGWPGPEDPLDLALAHELFHLLHPDCPSGLAEAAAHLFTSRLLGLARFAGEVDLLGEEVEEEAEEEGCPSIPG